MDSRSKEREWWWTILSTEIFLADVTTQRQLELHIPAVATYMCVSTSLNELHFHICICMRSDIELCYAVPKIWIINTPTLSCVSIGARCLRNFLLHRPRKFPEWSSTLLWTLSRQNRHPPTTITRLVLMSSHRKATYWRQTEVAGEWLCVPVLS